MFIIRIIIVLALFWLTLVLLGWVAKWWLMKKFKSVAENAEAPTKNLEGEKLIKCMYCGTYVVKESAIIKNDNAYCSEEHAKK